MSEKMPFNVVLQGLFSRINMDLDIESVADVSDSETVLIQAISVDLKRPPFSIGCKLILRRSLRQHNRAILRKRPILDLPSSVTSNILAQ